MEIDENGQRIVLRQLGDCRSSAQRSWSDATTHPLIENELTSSSNFHVRLCFYNVLGPWAVFGQNKQRENIVFGSPDVLSTK